MKKAHCVRFLGPVLGTLLSLSGCGDDGKPKGQAEPGPLAGETECSDGVDNDGDGVTDCDDLDCRVAGKSCELAPPLDRTVPTTVWEAAQFLFTGKDPVQKETSAKAFSRKRIAILRGKVVGRDGEPLAGVRVSIASHDEWGYTVSRPDGVFDLAVNGGSQLLVQFSRDDLLSAERGVHAAWRSYEAVPEVGMIAAGEAVTKIAGNADREQVAEGDVIEDPLGRRQPVVVFVKDTKATAKLADGSEEELKELHVRLAEYPLELPSAETIDEPSRFAPGTSPHPGSLSWGIEATIDEAQALGATTVEFSTPASVLVENFLGLPVGSPIPMGYYERGKGHWQKEQAGRVIQVVGVTDDEADVDVDGDGEADDEETLRKLHILHGTRRELARRYEPGAKVWHIPVEHFSPQFADIPTGTKPTAEAPTVNAATVRPIDEPTRHGSLLVERQALGQAFGLGLAGTPFSLRYQSDRTSEYRNGFRVDFPVIGKKIPEGLKSVNVTVRIAGQTLRETFKPEPDKRAVVDWNGKDAFGRFVQGQQRARVTLSYIYDGELRPSETFGATSKVRITSTESEDGTVAVDAALTKRFSITVGTWDASGYQLGGLGLDVLHAFDPGTGKIYFGSGDDRSAENVALVTTRPAGDAVLGTPDGVFAAPDGSVIVTEDDEERGELGALLRIAPDGTVSPITGEGAPGEAAELLVGSPQGVAMKSDGSIVFADFYLDAVREIAPDGSVRTLVGSASDPQGDPEIAATLTSLDGIALGLREELYIINGSDVLKLEGGQLSRFAGTGDGPAKDDVLDTENAPADTVALDVPSGVAVGPDGSVFISERDGARVRVVTPDGFIRTFAGTGVPGFSGDGQRATAAQLSDPRGLALATDGSLYIADQRNNRIRRVTPDGFIQTVVGGGDLQPRDSQLPTQIKLDKPDGITFSQDGALYVATGSTVYKIAPGLTELVDSDKPIDGLIPSEDGHTLYRFDARGKHKETINAVTGVTELTFGYDEAGLLTTIQDKNGLTTTIKRDEDGSPGTIVGPFGQRTNLDIFEEQLKSITDPLDRTVKLDYFPDGKKAGLLRAVVSPEGAERTFDYDKQGLGLLEKITDPSGFFELFEGKRDDKTISISTFTPDGKQIQYETSFQGDEIRRSVTGMDGTKSSSTEDRTDFPQLFADGTRVRTIFTPDAAFGSQVLVPNSRTVTTPGGRELQTFFLEEKSGGDSGNFLSLTRFKNTVEVNGRFTTTSYDRKDRTIRRESPLGRKSTTVLDELGRTTDTEAPGVGATHLEYDTRGRVVSMTRTAGKETRTQSYTYDDSDGFLRTATDALNQTSNYEPDIVGRLLGVVDPSGARFDQTFDRDDRLRLVTLPGGKDHAFVYRDKSSLLELTTPPSIDAAEMPKFAAGKVRYTYNESDQPTLIERSDGTNLEFAYDFAKRLSTLKTSGITLTRGYDEAGRLTSLSRSDGPTVSLGFDGPLLTSTEWTGPVEGKVTFDYDQDFRPSQITVNDSSTVSYEYDDDGALISATGNAQKLGVEHDPETGIVTGTTLGNVTNTFSTNAFGEPIGQQATFQGKVNFSQDLDRDELGRITRISEQVGVDATELEYTYDAAGRLETVTRNGVVTTYAYDDNGNRTSVSVDGVELAAADYDAQDRIISHGEMAFEQTKNGDLFRRTAGSSALELTYDGLGNLLTAAAASPQATKTIDYTVDGFGRRVGKQVDGKFARAWLYRDDLHPVAEITAAGVFSHFVYAGGGAPSFMLRAGVPFRFVKDHLGSVRVVVNATTGAVAQRLDYDEYGKVLLDSAPGFQPFGFAGGLYDPDTGLVRFGARDYDASIGRWVAKDPIGFGGGSNFYAYAAGDPVNHVDPDGMHPVVIAVATFLGILLATSDEEAYTQAGGALAGPVGGMAFKFVRPFVRARFTPRMPPIKLGNLRPGELGVTNKFGDITIARGLSQSQRAETLRHELVHALLSPRRGTFMANARADFGMSAYNKSNLVRFTEEFAAEFAGTGSVQRAVRQAMAHKVSGTGLAIEAGLYSGGVGGTIYWVGSE
ncbi:MAG TPA: RHS repeat-associated core domain-containing protein [Polyangiaceae bacterium]|nr:RHS repeat-associated core domain-containing protein [Polyangiaceae bacterium]